MINKNEETDIRKAEDLLFEEWALKRHPFATDGCADPDLYHRSDKKIVFVLKERNWGQTIEDQTDLQAEGRVEVVEERNVFGSWWTLMAQWADALLPSNGIDETWSQIEKSFDPAPELIGEERKKWVNDRNRKSLGKCACLQLKKSPGGGELNKEGLVRVVTEDKDFLFRQFNIYSPHFIVSCGSNDNWAIFTNILFKNPKIKSPKIEKTRNGINYFVTKLDGSKHKTAVVNFAHPSMRVNSRLWGVLAFGLREALSEIMPQLESASQCK